MQRELKAGVKSCSQTRILPLKSEDLTPEAQRRRLKAAQGRGWALPGPCGHRRSTAIHLLPENRVSASDDSQLAGGQQNPP